MEVLLAGQVPTEKDRLDAAALAAAQENVRHVTNDLGVGSMAGLSDSTADALLAVKVRSALLRTKGVPLEVIKTSCTLGSIYLFGKVSADEAEAAKRAASLVEGVKRVVAAFEILSPEEYAKYAPKPAS
jgi:osmotically-inducible protein OsmY